MLKTSYKQTIIICSHAGALRKKKIVLLCPYLPTIWCSSQAFRPSDPLSFFFFVHPVCVQRVQNAIIVYPPLRWKNGASGRKKPRSSTFTRVNRKASVKAHEKWLPWGIIYVYRRQGTLVGRVFRRWFFFFFVDNVRTLHYTQTVFGQMFEHTNKIT